MGLDIARLQDAVCKSLCADVALTAREDSRIAISTPFTFPDGDEFALFIEQRSSGGLRITDCGHTLMHLSYSMNVDELRSGNRGEIFRKILADHDISESDGELYVDVTGEQVGLGVFRMGQALTSVHDISFLSRQRVASAFYEDLALKLSELLPFGVYQKDWIVPDKKNADDYPIDFKIETRDPATPLFLFGISGSEKAKLTTLILEHWLREQVPFDSLLVFSDQTRIPRRDLARLTNVGGEQVASLDATEDLRRKLHKRMRPQAASA